MKKIILAAVLLCSFITFAQQSDQQSLKQSALQMLQPITVTIGGDFIVTGSFSAFKTERLDHFVTSVFTEAQQKALSSLNQLETIKIVSKEINKYALRDITLKHSNGESIKIDLLKFRLTGNFEYNPYLMNDDIIIFPSYDEERNVVEIDGAVNKPVKFQFVEGDKLSDAIMFAGGINPVYDNVKQAEISRLSNSGQKEENIVVALDSNFILKRGDRIRVLFDENNKKLYKVLVVGEVKQPGYVYITKSNSTIKEVINKAGGFNSNAWLERSELIRGTSESNILKMQAIRENYEKEKNFSAVLMEKYINNVYLENLKFLRMNDLYPEDSLSVVIDNTLRVLQHKSLINFKNVNSDSTSDAKYIVQDEDIIVIPQKEELVYVFGQVNKPGFIKYEAQKKYNDYINNAGGKGERAESEVKIIKGDSYAWITADEHSQIDPGDFIYIPKNIPKPFEYYFRTIATTVSTIATIILIYVQATK